MREYDGIWLPDGDVHFPEMLRNAPRFWKRPTYQVDKFLACLPHVKKFGHAVDIGAHCGLWSMVMAKCFGKLTAFEPLPRHVECWRKNVRDFNAVLHETALTDGASDRLMMRTMIDNSGLSHIDESGDIKVRAAPLDDGELDQIDFLKLDAEGYECPILIGGEQTIRRDRPCILIEAPSDGEAIRLLNSWGAVLRWTQGRDHCLSWDMAC